MTDRPIWDVEGEGEPMIERQTEHTVHLFIPGHDLTGVTVVMSLVRENFLPSEAVSFDERGGYLVALRGDEVVHLLELLNLATCSREAETVEERQANRARQGQLFEVTQ